MQEEYRAKKPPPSFGFSFGWLDKFQRHQNIKLHIGHIESGSVDLEEHQEAIEVVKSQLSNYKPKNIYNCDETSASRPQGSRLSKAEDLNENVEIGKGYSANQVISDACGTQASPSTNAPGLEIGSVLKNSQSRLIPRQERLTKAPNKNT
ncbi:hypothetical protein BGZ58_007687 [Dissophora ornata]|nr:hypothetical protein BGZ58_007687 [Dissophora ornata]